MMATTNYTPFGDEWKEHLMKRVSKSQIIDTLADSLKKNQKARRIAQPPTVKIRGKVHTVVGVVKIGDVVPVVEVVARDE